MWHYLWQNYPDLMVAQLSFGSVIFLCIMFLAWDGNSADIRPSWWTQRHAAILTLFFPLTYLASLPFCGALALYFLGRSFYSLWTLATTIER